MHRVERTKDFLARLEGCLTCILFMRKKMLVKLYRVVIVKVVFFLCQSCSLWVERGGCIHVFDHGIVTGMVHDLCIVRRVHIKLS